MLQSKIINAYKSLIKLSQLDLPIRLAFDLFKVKMVLQPQWDFQIEVDMKFPKVRIPLSIPGLKLSVEDIEALKDFVTFE